jgi:hypothetical protein
VLSGPARKAVDDTYWITLALSARGCFLRCSQRKYVTFGQRRHRFIPALDAASYTDDWYMRMTSMRFSTMEPCPLNIRHLAVWQ